MKRKGISYDVGREMYGDWRPDFDPKIVHQELQIIKNDLHCNTIRICGKNISRLMITAEDALQQGLEVWLSPELWNKSPDVTLDYIVKAGKEMERLREKYPEKLILSIGSEFTLFMQDIIKGRTVMKRLQNAFSGNFVREGKHNKPLNDYLSKVNKSVREVFHGSLTYASLLWEKVDWNLFDFVGVDHYRTTQIKDKYAEMLKPSFNFGKPVIITEFGYCTYKGAEDAGGRASFIIDIRSLVLHRVPLIGRFVQPRLKGTYIRDEVLQAREIVDQLTVLDNMNVEGVFIMTFVTPNNPYNDDPKYDLDMASYSLVKSYENGRHGTTYPDMTWEPKESFYAVADYYGKK